MSERREMEHKQAAQLLREARKLRRKASLHARRSYAYAASVASDLADEYEVKAWRLLDENPN